MSRLVVEGLSELNGEVRIQGSKNSTLPILAASLITGEESVIHNCPMLTDVDASIKILRYLGCRVQKESSTLIIDSSSDVRDDIPEELMREMRSSIIFMGALLTRNNKSRLTLPGGCDLGPRPIDLHLNALRNMGVEVHEHRGIIDCYAPNGIKGAKIALGFPSVGATENVILAAVKAQGTTIITNAAAEPEITDLCDFLNSCGAKISGGGSSTIIIDGVKKMHGAQHAVIPDRIAVATYMAGAAVSGGMVTLCEVIPHHLSSVIPVFEESGCTVTLKGSNITITAPKRLKPPKLIRTMPYPGFPTDAQPPIMAMSAFADGTTVFVENIFENRYNHVSELVRMGAKINTTGKVAVVEGVKRLYGANVEAQDLRGAASLVVASLGAEGRSVITGLEYLERGYEDLDVKLAMLGASIKKI